MSQQLQDRLQLLDEIQKKIRLERDRMEDADLDWIDAPSSKLEYCETLRAALLRDIKEMLRMS